MHSGIAYFHDFKCRGYSDWEDFISPNTFTSSPHGVFIVWLISFLVWESGEEDFFFLNFVFYATRNQKRAVWANKTEARLQSPWTHCLLCVDTRPVLCLQHWLKTLWKNEREKGVTGEERKGDRWLWKSTHWKIWGEAEGRKHLSTGWVWLELNDPKTKLSSGRRDIKNQTALNCICSWQCVFSYLWKRCHPRTHLGPRSSRPYTGVSWWQEVEGMEAKGDNGHVVCSVPNRPTCLSCSWIKRVHALYS